MSRAAKFADTLPQPEDTKLVQAHINKDLHAKVKTKMEREAKTRGVTAEWKQLIEFCFHKYLEEK